MQRSLKSVWKEHPHQVWGFYCPLCRAERRLPFRPSPGPRHYAQIGLTTVFLAVLTWPLFGWKGLVLFLPLWTVFEMVYRARARAHLHCSQCGFDPYLYLVDVKRARKEVELHWRKKFAEHGVPYPGDAPRAEEASASETGP